MTRERVNPTERLKIKILSACNNRCCICQTPFVVLHHIDGKSFNTVEENLAPLCPNCHAQAHSSTSIAINLSPERIKALRDIWYSYCEKRKEGSNIGENAGMKLRNFIRGMGLADYSWKNTFSKLHAEYGNMSREEIIDHVFSTTNRDELVTILETIKSMYHRKLAQDQNMNKFEIVCNAFGIGIDELI